MCVYVYSIRHMLVILSNLYPYQFTCSHFFLPLLFLPHYCCSHFSIFFFTIIWSYFLSHHCHDPTLFIKMWDIIWACCSLKKQSLKFACPLAGSHSPLHILQCCDIYHIAVYFSFIFLSPTNLEVLQTQKLGLQIV